MRIPQRMAQHIVLLFEVLFGEVEMHALALYLRQLRKEDRVVRMGIPEHLSLHSQCLEEQIPSCVKVPSRSCNHGLKKLRFRKERFHARKKRRSFKRTTGVGIRHLPVFE